MAIREILTVPDPRLKEVSKPVMGGVTDDIRALMDDMLETMYEAPGIGLAAIQVGVALRVIVIDLARDGETPDPRYFVNPEILETVAEEVPHEEGCLSVPDVYDEIDRPVRCHIRYLNYAGDLVEEWADDMYAVCIQHEMDHLEGTLFIDYLSRLKRSRAVEKVKKARRLKAREEAA